MSEEIGCGDLLELNSSVFLEQIFSGGVIGVTKSWRPIRRPFWVTM